MYYQVFRGDGSSNNYTILSAMLEDFDRQDVEDLYRIVKNRFASSRPEGYDLMLWGDVHTFGVHIVLMQNGIAIHMLTEKIYPLSQVMLNKMLRRGLEVDHKSTQAFELLSYMEYNGAEKVSLGGVHKMSQDSVFHNLQVFQDEDFQRNLKFTSESQVRGGLLGNIVNRLKSVSSNKVVSKEQSAFILGRQILNDLLIISEIIQWNKKRKKNMLIFKVDFEQAFDSVSWKYLDFVLHSLNFGSKWRSWIRACLHSSRASILINSIPTSEFSIKRSLRQGDPLSPFLFILIMEGLHCAIYNAVSSGLIRRIKLGSSDITLSDLFYADDMVITTNWNSHDINNII
ncbi:RNA-directed DNA polymerase, eukaryota, reverse transcriptase zinc-binding domain protein [Tanacetum coccineum]